MEPNPKTPPAPTPRIEVVPCDSCADKGMEMYHCQLDGVNQILRLNQPLRYCGTEAEAQAKVRLIWKETPHEFVTGYAASVALCRLCDEPPSVHKPAASPTETRPPQPPEKCPLCESTNLTIYAELDGGYHCGCNDCRHGWTTPGPVRAAALEEPPTEGCSQSERDKQILAALEDESIVYYGPHLCDLCGRRMICKTGNGYQPTIRFDYPGDIVYPNHNWTVHRCPPKPICICATSKICPVHSDRVPAPEREPAPRPQMCACLIPQSPPNTVGLIERCYRCGLPCIFTFAASSPAARPPLCKDCSKPITGESFVDSDGDIHHSPMCEPAARTEQPTPLDRMKLRQRLYDETPLSEQAIEYVLPWLIKELAPTAPAAVVEPRRTKLLKWAIEYIANGADYQSGETPQHDCGFSNGESGPCQFHENFFKLIELAEAQSTEGAGQK